MTVQYSLYGISLSDTVPSSMVDGWSWPKIPDPGIQRWAWNFKLFLTEVCVEDLYSTDVISKSSSLPQHLCKLIQKQIFYIHAISNLSLICNINFDIAFVSYNFPGFII